MNLTTVSKGDKDGNGVNVTVSTGAPLVSNAIYLTFEASKLGTANIIQLNGKLKSRQWLYVNALL